MKIMKKNSGITLLEVIVAICIASLLAFFFISITRKVIDNENRQKMENEFHVQAHEQQIYSRGFTDGMNMVVAKGIWTGSNIILNATNLFEAMKY